MTQNISPRQAYEWLKNGEAVLIDVREPDEFSAEHIAYASSLPLKLVGDMLRMIDIPPGRKIIFQCKKGGRGSQACAVIMNAPALDAAVFNIDGGLDAWKADGLPIVGASGPRVPIFRQVQMIVGAVLFALIMLGLAGIGFAFMLAAIVAGLFAFTGLIGWCGLAMLLQKMPWNRG